ncbi:hypothetical protein [Lewinella sp. 4G2]|uniref:HU domain-containing protein n=1 Tax=Lewinella sp. 4G2 TaxID=1803372 RepID=UPI0007B46037|nr:hypothetical protein [Lewinella sp. 4G2]OAV45645.1 hypothetical protein A3850_014585 [Lewinella sp. 4G2]
MSDLLQTTLREVLVDEGRVALPSLGTFIRENYAAVLSGADRKILPPSARVVFNGNLIVNDGRLLRALVEKKGMLRPQAEREMQALIADIRSRLQTGEHVKLDGIGTLFQQFDDQIVFTTVAEGLSKKAFGLPAVAFQPINRRATAEVAGDPLAGASLTGTGAAVGGSEAAATATLPPRREAKVYPPALWYTLGIILLLIALWAIYGLFRSVAGASTDDPRSPVVQREQPVTAPPVRQNTAPAPAPVPANSIQPDEAPRLTNERNRVDDEAAKTRPVRQPGTSDGSAIIAPAPTTVAPPRPATNTTGTNVALIATGLYGNAANVRKNVLRIEQAGFEAFTEKAGRYTRVGVKTTYTTAAERDRALAKVRARFTTDAFVMRINGKKVR